jgi:polyhydroxybutyrate depolymerase
MVLTLLVALGLLAADPLAPGDHQRQITVGELERSYLVHVPPQAEAGRPLPVVLMFHGALTNGQGMVRFTGLNAKADEAGFIVVYPDGTGRLERMLTWNGGNCCGYAAHHQVDDVGFVRALLDQLAGEIKIDARRVFATGISNGGIFCYRLADELSDRIAAIAPVSGTMGAETCHPQHPVSVIHFHGTADEFVPFAGGKGDKSLASIHFFSVEHSIQNWIKADGCPATPTVTRLPRKPGDPTSVVRKVFGPGKQGSEVVLYQIEGGGHTWPGHPLPYGFLGKATETISANDLMWEFFQRHPRE